jgi:hypothetical protein
MTAEWMVAAVLLFVGLIAAVGIYLGEQDPETRAYKPSSLYSWRIAFRSPFSKTRGQHASSPGEGHGNNANEGGEPN